uniref:MD-2-related lipid-recognition domain-containing protein n=1 Tax=Anopheles farauti TaxID=69004 RepID=A0A182QLL3_9DIPT
MKLNETAERSANRGHYHAFLTNRPQETEREITELARNSSTPARTDQLFEAAVTLWIVAQLAKVEVKDTSLLRVKAHLAPYGRSPLKAINVEGILTRDLSQVKLNAVYTVCTKDGELKAALYNTTVNACDFLQQPTHNRLLQIFQNEVIQSSNLPHRCPIPAGTYTIRNASFSKARIPGFLPASHFRVDINLLSGSPAQMMLETSWYGKLIKI